MNERIRSICRTQNIEYKKIIKAKCPICGERELVLKLNHDKAKCRACYNTRSVEVWDTLVQDQFEHQNRFYIELMR